MKKLCIHCILKLDPVTVHYHKEDLFPIKRHIKDHDDDVDDVFSHVFFSSYPEKRVEKDSNGIEYGIPGSVSLLQNATLSTQPISSFDWSPDKVLTV